MRRRKKKGSDIKLLSHTNYVIRENVESYKGKWHDKFGNNNPIHAEFGTGRGKFITTLAKENPNINYIAMEIKEEVLLKAVEKAAEQNLTNILFIWGDVNQIEEYFEKGELERVYINFCDPWPKKRWAKRRLTHTGFLNKYYNILNEKGEVHFKSDNERLFEFTLNEFCNNPWKLKNICLDLGNNEDVYNVTTEYEDKFMSQGMKIYRCEAQKVINTSK